MPVIKVTSDEHFTELLNSPNHDYIFVDFYADWCGPCKRIAPKLEQFSTQFKTVLFAKVNVDELEDLAQTYNITGMPTFLMFERGSPVQVSLPIVGANEEKIMAALLAATTTVEVKEDF